MMTGLQSFQHAHLTPRQHQLVLQQQLLRLWQQQQCPSTHGCMHTHRARSRSSRVASALDKLDIKPISITAEERQLPEQPAADLNIQPLDAWCQDPFLISGCEPGAAPLRVAVLVSGGVDSSLALQLVTAAGHKATAFYLQIWFQEDFRNFWDACPWEEDLSYAQQVCDALGVPLVVVPLTQQYWDRVVAHSVADIKAGRTPNPDMWCNSRVKFGAFVEYLQQQHAGSFDRIASGHYAKVQRHPQQQQQHSQPPPPQQQQHEAQGGGSQPSPASDSEAEAQSLALLEQQASLAQASSSGNGSSSDNGSSSRSSSDSQPVSLARLLMVPDAVKDQTYFLADLSPAQLARCMFPLGNFTKPQVRALAAAAGLATSGRKDSQGICFLGKVKFGEFVAQHLGEWPGPLVEEDSGQVVGVHDGYWFYTVGQRGGIKLPGGPWYVTRKDLASNTVYVSRTYYEQERRRDAFVCGPLNWLGPWRPVQGVPLVVKVRHGPNVYQCSLRLCSEAEAGAVLEQGSSAALEPWSGSSSGSGSIGGSSNGGSSSGGSQPAAACSSMQQQQQEEDAVQQQEEDAVQRSSSAAQQFGVVLLSQNDQGLAAGQYAVFYQDQQCLGSAQIMGSVATSSSTVVEAWRGLTEPSELVCHNKQP